MLCWRSITKVFMKTWIHHFADLQDENTNKSLNFKYWEALMSNLLQTKPLEPSRFYGHGTNFGWGVGYPLECDLGGQLHKLLEEIFISKNIPMEGRRILNLDKSGTPHIRRRQMD
ncbi:hypothetical protein KY284_001166 [Solanum tuberosum]|nr:hypothetical protein KY284_001166 [Solanum tuberosum]